MTQGKMKGGPTQKHLHSRISYLYQAATFLTEAASSEPSIKHDVPTAEEMANTGKCEQGSVRLAESSAPVEESVIGTCRSNPSVLSRPLLAHVRAISRKSQIRITPNIKRSICKRCDALLLPGSTSTSHVENKSRNGSKPWANILVTTCLACGTVKRFPVREKRQMKRRERMQELLGRYKKRQAAKRDSK